MKKHLLAIAISTSFILSACTQQTDDVKTQVQKSQSEVKQQAVPQAELGRFGIDLSARNTAVKPGDDFFEYASGTWYKNFEMPADKTRFGAFDNLHERSEERVQSIVENVGAIEDKSLEEALISDFYAAYMNTQERNAKGITPLAPMLEQINAITTLEDLAKVFGSTWLSGTNSPIYSGLGFNRLNPDEYQISIGVSGLGMPDRSYYLEEGERFDDIRTAYIDNLTQVLGLIGETSPADAAQRIFALEKKIAEIQWPREKRRNRDLTFNPTEREKLKEDYAGFPWDEYFAARGYQAPNPNISHPEPLKQIISLINQTPMDVWKEYLSYHLVSGNADYLSDDIYDVNFAFYNKVLNGQQTPRPLWKRAVNEMSGSASLGFAIGKIYVDKYFPESSKAQMSELVENLRQALGERIQNLDWMGQETKQEALAKLQAFNPKIGYPDEWESFEGLSLSSSDLLGNIHKIREFFRAKSIEDELKPTNKNDWFMPPQTVNAYYNSSFNEIVFPAAILQAPFFDPAADPAVNYGAIGAVIGHEMGHGFDDQGSKSDANGIQRNWWTDEDRDAFETKTQMLIDQYSAYEPIEGNFVNGQNSLGENIGDVGGLAMAYHAYKLSLKGQEAPVIDGLTGDQRFFLAWAQVWREKRTEESMLNQLRAGTHSPGKYRALAPRNHDAWYEAFDVQEGDALYLAPEERVRIW